MKLFTNKKLIQKITIVMVFLILFNFIVPTYSRAESAIESAGKVIFTPVRAFLVMIGDAVMNGLQYLLKTNEKAVIPYSDQVDDANQFIGNDQQYENLGDYMVGESGLGDLVLDIYGSATGQDKPNFKYTPQFIFENKIKTFDINFITSSRDSDTKTDTENSNETKSNLQDEKWYSFYEYTVDKCKTEFETATDDTKKGIARQILRLLGAFDNATNTVTYTDETAISAVKELSQRYYNGQNMYEMLGANTTDTSSTMKQYVQFIDSGIGTNIVAIVAAYHKTAVNSDKETIDYEKNAPVNALHDMIATWYRILRNIAIVFLLSILVYVGIRIMISSTAADSAKYKKMIIDWVVALCILFALHYIMAFVNAAVDTVTGAFSSSGTETDAIFGVVRKSLESDNFSDQLFYTLLYIVLVIYTVVFTVYYLKRVVYAAFLTMIAPLVALTYPLDRIGDGKSQAFDMWLKEYIANVIIQPVHLLLYTILISSALSLAKTNPLYAIVVMGAMMPVEKFIREMFGLNSKKGPGPAGGLAAGALAMNAFGKLMHGKPPIPHVDKNKSNSGDASTEKEKKPRTQTTKDANSSDYEAIIDEGDFGQSNENSIKDNKNPDANENEEIDNGQPRWNSNLSEEQRDELKAEGLESGDAEYDQYLAEQGIKSESNQQLDDKNINSTNENDNITQDLQSQDNNIIQENMNIGKEENNENLDKSIENISKENISAQSNNKKVKPSAQAKRRAKAARNNYVNAKLITGFKSLGKGTFGLGKKLVKGAVKTAGAAVGVTAGATVALGATIASGDADKLLSNMSTGVLAGVKGGKTAADFAIGTAGTAISKTYEGAKDGIDTFVGGYQTYRDTLMKEDKDYKKAKEKAQIHRIAHSHTTKSKVKAYYGNLSDEERDEKLNKIEDYMDFGVKDTETIMKAMDLVDNNGFTEKEAKMAAFQSERFEKDDDDGRNRVRRQMENAFLNASILNGDSSSEATRKSELQSDKLLQGIDRIHGVKEKEVGRPERELRRRQLAEENKKQLDREEAARLTAEAQRKIRQNNQQR